VKIIASSDDWELEAPDEDGDYYLDNLANDAGGQYLSPEQLRSLKQLLEQVPCLN
jgi:hypothetical protein